MTKTHEECLIHLEQIRWNGIPTCPYCDSIKSTSYKKEHRYRCNSCFTSYSVTVGTVFHQSHLDLKKWFLAIHMLNCSPHKITIRQISSRIGVSKNTASYLRDRIVRAIEEEPIFIQKIVDVNLDQ